MATQVRPPLAQPGETRTIIAWTKEIGDTVKSGETICEVETDKAAVEIESQTDGILVAQLFEVGDEIPEDGPIALIGDAGEIGASPEVDESISDEIVEERELPAKAPSELTAASEPIAISEADARQRIAVSPRARNRAEELSVPLTSLTGSGPGGRIIERDVLAVAGTSKPEKSPQAMPGLSPAEQLIPVKGARRIVAERMHASLRDTAQLTMTAYADATCLLELRTAFKNADPKFQADGITLNDLILFTVTRTLLEHPELNSTYRDTGGELEIVRPSAVHLAFAVDTPRVLMVPVIRDADGLRLRDLSVRTFEMAERCRRGTITAEELSGGTFTVSNLGAFGVESFTPILNPPQAAILGVGSIAWRPISAEACQQQLALSLTIDHRRSDGAPAARFLQTLCARFAELDVLLAL